MKKIAIFFLIIIIIIAGVFYVYLNYKANWNIVQRQNRQFESYLEQEIYGSELATILNKAIDNNEKNEIPKDNKGNYKEDGNHSIKIEIYMLDNEETYQMETLFRGGIDKFVQYYNAIKFKCTTIKHHKTTSKVSYMRFEQITN